MLSIIFLDLLSTTCRINETVFQHYKSSMIWWWGLYENVTKLRKLIISNGQYYLKRHLFSTVFSKEKQYSILVE